MRIFFSDQHSPEEAALFADIQSRIARWWDAFTSTLPTLTDYLRRRVHQELGEWMQAHLRAIDPRLNWEYGAIGDEQFQLVITAENLHTLRPLVDLILASAPPLAGWKFYPSRPSVDIGTASAMVKGRTGGRIDDVEVHIQQAPHKLVSLRFSSPRYLAIDEQTARHETFVATEALLGEETFEDWIGGLGTCPPRAGERTLKLDRMHDTTMAIIARIREQLPREPYWCRRDAAQWHSYQLNIKRTPDELPERRDLFVGVTCDMDLINAALSPRVFRSQRFSACGETLCYVKIDGRTGLQGSRWKDRGEVEDALSAILQPAELGAVIGGGTGLRHSYIDLALTDLRQGCRLIRDTLGAGGMPTRTWILFFDSTMKDEWVGIYDQTPPPLLASST